MSSTMLVVWLVIAVSIMLGMDILDAIVKYRNNKIEERRRQAEEEMAKAYKPPEIAITNPKIIPLRAEMTFLPYETTSEQVRTELGKMLLYLINEKDLINFHVFEDPTTNRRRIEATLKIAKFDDDRDILD